MFDGNHFTYEFVKNYIEIESKSRCVLLSTNYKNANQKLSIQCKCGEQFERKFYDFKNRRRHMCKKCGSIKKRKNRIIKKENEISQEINKITNGKLKYINGFKSVDECMKVLCVCGSIDNKSLTSIRSGSHTCKKCANKIRANKKKILHTTIAKYFSDKSNLNGCTLMSKINSDTDTYTELIFRCKCSNEFKSCYSYFKHRDKKRCDSCGKELNVKFLRLDFNEIKNEIECNGNKKLIILSKREDYTNSGKSKLIIQCECGNIYKTTLQRYRRLKENVCNVCGKRNNSKGNNTIKNILNNFECKHETEKTFNDCMSSISLRFDFSIHNCILEYDGQQHFNAVRFGGISKLDAISNFNTQIKRDKIKNQYCIDNNIPLIRIPYWEFNNIEYILENVLKHYNLIESDNTYDKEIVYKYLVDEHWDHDIYLKWNDKENRDMPMKQYIIK